MSQLKEVQAAMGAVVFSFQQLEYELIEVLYAVIDLPTIELIKVLQTKFEFGRSMKLLVAVAEKKIRDENMFNTLEKIVQKARKFANERNVLIHSHYHVTNSSHKDLLIKRSSTRLRSGGNNRIDLVADELIQFAEEVNQTIREVETFYEDLIHYLYYDPAEEEGYQQIELSQEELDKLFRNIGDIGNVDTGGTFLLGKRPE